MVLGIFTLGETRRCSSDFVVPHHGRCGLEFDACPKEAVLVGIICSQYTVPWLRVLYIKHRF